MSGVLKRFSGLFLVFSLLGVLAVPLAGREAGPAWRATTWYVDGQAGDDGWSGLCETWDGGTCGPKATIQAALDAAAAGDEIIVAPARYYENIAYGGKNVRLRAKHASSGLADPFDPLASIIDGSQPTDPNVGCAVRFHGTELPACALEGFTITGGTGLKSAEGWREGGGVFGGDAGSLWVWTRASIRDCTIIGNKARFGGGLWQCGGQIRDCVITGNWTEDPGGSNHHGGGLGACNGQIVGCTISGNQSYGGAGLYSCIGLITHCTITRNDASWSGGAMMWCDNCTVVNCDISANRASLSGLGAGGAVFSQKATYVNCTLANNSSLQGGAIYAWQKNAPTLYNCVVWGNQSPKGAQIALNTSAGTQCKLVIAYSDLQGGQAGVWIADPTWCVIDWGAGMSVADPLFADPAQDDFRLTAGSPGIDAGDNAAVPADVADLDGDGDTAEPVPLDADGLARFVDDPATTDTGHGTAPLVDMGAYEFAAAAFDAGDLNCDGQIDAFDIDPFVLALTDPAGYAAKYPDCDFTLADINGDGKVDAFDIDPFVKLLIGG